MYNTVSKETLREEIAKVWDSERMIKYVLGQVQVAAVLEDGTIITIDKQSIETRFCFGESGYDYDEAAEGVRTAYTSTEYLKRENMRDYDRKLAEIDEAATFDGYVMLTVRRPAYYGQTRDCRLGCLDWRRTTDVLEDLGGSAYLDRLPGQTIQDRTGGEYRILTASDIETVREAYKAARAAHEKKVDAYIKRYGTSNVTAWTYWRDA